LIDGRAVGLDAEDADRDRLRVASGLRRGLAQGRDLGDDPRSPEADGHPAVAELDHALEGRGAVTAHEDRRMGLLEGLGMGPDPVEAHVLAVVFGLFFGPDLLHRQYTLPEHAPTLLEGSAV